MMGTPFVTTPAYKNMSKLQHCVLDSYKSGFGTSSTMSEGKGLGKDF